MKSTSDILIVKPSSLGDIFHTFPAVALLRKHHPNAQIDWLVNPEFADAIDFCPSKIRRKIIFPRRELARFSKFCGAFLRLTRQLRAERYQMVIDFQGLFRSAFFGWLCKTKHQIGFANPKEFSAKLFYHRIFIPESSADHAIERNLSLAKQLLKNNDTPAMPELTLMPVPRFTEAVNQHFSNLKINADDLLIAVTPGARWESKCWPPEFFANVIAKTAQVAKEAKFLILGSNAERLAAQQVMEQVPGVKIVSLAGETSIGELIEIIRRCQVLISNDSGPIHIAAAAQVPVFAFFGPTDPDLTGPYGADNQVFQAEVECLKCFERKCPGKGSICQSLNAEEVSDSLINHLKNKDLL